MGTELAVAGGRETPLYRRAKIVMLPEGDILKILLFRDAPMGTLLCISAPDMPDDVVIHSVHYDYECRSFGIIVLHETFPDADPGSHLERVLGELRFCQFKPDDAQLASEIKHLGSVERAREILKSLLKAYGYRKTIVALKNLGLLNR